MKFEARPELTIFHQFMVGSVQAFLPSGSIHGQLPVSSRSESCIYRKERIQLARAYPMNAMVLPCTVFQAPSRVVPINSALAWRKAAAMISISAHEVC